MDLRVKNIINRITTTTTTITTTITITTILTTTTTIIRGKENTKNNTTTSVTMASLTSPKLISGLQKEVYSLYRTILREAVKKDRVALQAQAQVEAVQVQESKSSLASAFPTLLSSPTTTSHYAKTQFRKQSLQPRRGDFKTIEFKLRHGHKQLKLLKMPGVKVVGGV
jgi:hypothetical protein